MTKSVQSLQHLLNHLARTVPDLPPLVETGIFDEPTLEAVMIFQRDNSLPVTGMVDHETWYAIVAAYDENLFQYGAPPPLHVFPHGGVVVEKEVQSGEIRIVQAIMTELLKHIANFEEVLLDGVNNGATHRNLGHLQGLSGLSPTGILDRATWDLLSGLYRALETRKAYVILPL